MKLNGKGIAIIAGSVVAGALLTWVVINWIPSTTILVGAVASGYVAWLKVK